MAQEDTSSGRKEEIPKGQKFFDNLLWLFILSLLISLVAYNVWGVIEILNTPSLP